MRRRLGQIRAFVDVQRVRCIDLQGISRHVRIERRDGRATAPDDVWMIHAARNTPMTAERETTLTITLTYKTLIPQRLEVITGEISPLIGVYRLQLPRRVQ